MAMTGIQSLHDNRQEYNDQKELASDGRSQFYSNNNDFADRPIQPQFY
jgi:hypothetical protein